MYVDNQKDSVSCRFSFQKCILNSLCLLRFFLVQVRLLCLLLLRSKRCGLWPHQPLFIVSCFLYRKVSLVWKFVHCVVSVQYIFQVWFLTFLSFVQSFKMLPMGVGRARGRGQQNNAAAQMSTRPLMNPQSRPFQSSLEVVNSVCLCAFVCVRSLILICRFLWVTLNHLWFLTQPHICTVPHILMVPTLLLTILFTINQSHTFNQSRKFRISSTRSLHLLQHQQQTNVSR